MSEAAADSDASLARRARRARAVLLAVVAVTAVVKIAAVLAGADPDGDAYGHAMAGRRMLLTPGDVGVHWVWLPVLHGAYALAIAAGGGLRAVRLASVLISSATPILLAWFLRDHLRRMRAPDADTSLLPWLSGTLLAAEPLCTWSGATGQTEPLFSLLILGGTALWERRRPALAGTLFAISALTRYESWALLPALILLAARGWPPEGPERSPPRDPWWRGARRHLVYALPAIAIAGWLALHARVTGEPFQMFRLNRDFVRGYFATYGYLWGPDPDVLRMLGFYVLFIPVRAMLGPVYLLAFAGLPRALRGHLPGALLLLGATLLAVVTVGFLRGSHIGLPRHAVVCAPFFCALTATGALALADRLSAWRPRLAPDRARLATACAVLAIVLATRTAPGAVRLWRDARHAFSAEVAAARALREAARPGETIFCEDAPVEVLSGLPPAAFVRWQAPDVTQVNLIGVAHERGSALVVARTARTGHLAGGIALWSGEGFAITRYEDAGR